MVRQWLPAFWRADPARFLPGNPALYDGPRLPFWLLCVLLMLITARSCVHLLAPDGGAHSIATVDLSVAGAGNIVAMFGQWGAIQLLLAGLMWVLVLRYRGLVPPVLATLIVEPFLRSLSGHLKPLVTLHTAPGAALNFVFLPLLVLLLYMSLCPARKTP